MSAVGWVALVVFVYAVVMSLYVADKRIRDLEERVRLMEGDALRARLRMTGIAEEAEH